MDKGPVIYGLIGEYQVGKSTLVNCLLSRPLSSVGTGAATTHTVVVYEYSNSENKLVFYKDGRVERMSLDGALNADQDRNVDKIIFGIRHPILEKISIIDLPGVGNDDCDNARTHEMLDKIDCAILVHTTHKSLEDESKILNTIGILQKKEIPYYVVLNCANLNGWAPEGDINESIASRMMEVLSFYPPLNRFFCDNRILIVNLMWYWYATALENDELANRYRNSFRQYVDVPQEAFKEASQFYLIQQIFDNMNNELYLALKKEFRESIKKLKRELCPIGTIQAFAFDRVPEGWLPCDGRLLSKKIYPDLFKAIGTTFGSGGARSGQFNIPNLCGRFIRGWASTGVVDPNRRFGSIQEDALQGHGHEVQPSETDYSGEHTHRVRYRVYKVGSNSFSENDMPVYEIPASSNYKDYGNDPGTDEDGWHSHDIPPMIADDIVSTNRTTVRVANETRPANVALRYCIKALDC